MPGPCPWMAGCCRSGLSILGRQEPVASTLGCPPPHWVLFKYLWLMAISEHPSCNASEQHKETELEKWRHSEVFQPSRKDPWIHLASFQRDLLGLFVGLPMSWRERDEGWPDYRGRNVRREHELLQDNIQGPEGDREGGW